MIDFNKILNCDLKKEWIYVDKKGNINVQKKDNKFVRVLKGFLSTCGCFDPYRSIRLKNVVSSISMLVAKDPSNAKVWRQVLNKISAVKASQNKKYSDNIGSLSKMLQEKPDSVPLQMVATEPTIPPQKANPIGQIIAMAQKGNLKCLDMLETLRKKISRKKFIQIGDKMMTLLINQNLVLKFDPMEKCYIPIIADRYDPGPHRFPDIMLQGFVNKSWAKPCKSGKGFIITLPKWTLHADLEIQHRCQNPSIVGSTPLKFNEKAASYYLYGKDLHLSGKTAIAMIFKRFNTPLLIDFDPKIKVTVPTALSRHLTSPFLQGWILSLQVSVF